jgi:acid phosphatase type 7
MKLIKRLGLITLALVIVYGIARTGQKYYDSLYYGERAVYLQMLGTNQVTLKWQTKNDSIGNLRYGLSPDNLNQSASEIKKTTEHEITILNLKPDTKYWYQINSKTHHFTTAPFQHHEKPVYFWVIGDPGKPSKKLKQVRNSAYQWIKQNRPERPEFDLILTTGDNAYRSGKNNEFQKALFEIHKDSLSRTNLWPAYGNHDARRWSFFDIFKFPTRGELGGVASGTENYFSFDYGNIHLVFLDSEAHIISRAGEMTNWLKQDLDSNQLPWVFVLFHSPPYSKGSHDSDSYYDSRGRMFYMREKVVPILDKFGVDLVLTGHSHSFERSHLLRCHYDTSDTFKQNMIVDLEPPYEKPLAKAPYSGAIYTVLGSSSKLDFAKHNHPALPKSHNEFGSIIVKAHKNTLEFWFINHNGEVKDNFKMVKSQGLAPAIAGCLTP